MDQKVMGILASVLSALLLGACESFHLQEPPAHALAVAEVAPGAADDTVIALINNVDLSLLLERKARRVGFRLLSRERLSGLGVVLLTFAVPTGLDPRQAAGELERLEPHATADRDHVYSLTGAAGQAPAAAGDPRYFADAMIRWPAGGCPARRRLGMIDSGVDLRAPSLMGQRIVARSFVGDDAGDARSHGTAVAQTLLGAGRLRDSTLHVATVVDERRPGRGPSAAVLIRALDWLARSQVELVNVSLAGPYNRALDRAVQRSAAQGLVLVAAVGNDGPDSPPRYPAAFREVIAVTAVDAGLRVYDGAVVGTHVDFAAPGVDIYVQADGSGRFVTGTSFATPFVVSIIASDPRLVGLAHARELRQAMGDRVRDLGTPGHDEIYGFGMPTLSASCGAST